MKLRNPFGDCALLYTLWPDHTFGTKGKKGSLNPSERQTTLTRVTEIYLLA